MSTKSGASGIAPLAVYFDASATTDASVTSKPFHELYYKWTFGKTAAGSYTYGARSDLSRNVSYGPLAATVYETAGTYNWTLTVSDGTNTDTYNGSITVTDPDAYFSGTNTVVVATDGVFTGKPAGATEATSSDFDAMITTHATAGKRVLFKKGQTFVSSVAPTIAEDGPGYVGAWGSGAAPIISGDFGILLGSNTNHDFADWRFVDLDFQGSADTANHTQALGAADYITFLRCKWSNHNIGINLSLSTLDTINASSVLATIWTGWCLAECEMTSMDEYNVLAPLEKVMVLGNKFDPIVDGTGHTFRLSHTKGAVIWANQFDATGGPGVPATIRGIGFATVSPTLGTGVYTEKVVFRANKALGGTGPYITAICQRPNDLANDYRFRNILIEGNWLVQTNGANQRFCKIEGSNITFRNNLCMATVVSTVSLAIITLDRNTTAELAAFDDIDVYNNTFYSGQVSAQTCAYLDITASAVPTDVNISNNIGYLPSFSTFLFTNGTFGANGEHDNSPTTNSTAGAAGEMDATSPSFATSDGLGTGTLTAVNDFKILTASYAKGRGADGLFVIDDFFDNIRLLSPADTDMGFHAFTTGSLPA